MERGDRVERAVHSNSLWGASQYLASVYRSLKAKQRNGSCGWHTAGNCPFAGPFRWPSATPTPCALPLELQTPASEPSCVERAFLNGTLSQERRRPSRPCAPRPASPAPPARSCPEARSYRGARQGKPGSVRDLGPVLPRTREAAAPGTGAGMEGGAWLGQGAGRQVSGCGSER